MDEAVHDTFLTRFKEQTLALFSPGDPLDPSTSMGPLVDLSHQSKVLAFIETGINEGAKLSFGGRVPAHLNAGCFVEPTLFTDVDNSMTVAREEIFGPVTTIIPVKGGPGDRRGQ